MNGEFLLFVFFLVILFVGMIIRGIFGRKSADYKKSLGELTRQLFEHETRLSITLLLLGGVFLMLGVVIYAFFTPLYPWTQLPLPDLVRWTGVTIGLVSIPFIGWIHWVLGRAFSKSLTIQEGHQLVTTGPYRRIRHPMYTVFIVYFLSLFLISTNLFLLITWILMIITFIVRIPKEEQMLLDQFGEAYREYMKKTGRLLPRLRKRQDTRK
ncbi:MAG: isoprenylcysteine carboxylmethyltransferase family protein [Candidatus Hodarchaeota archaeon]